MGRGGMWIWEGVLLSERFGRLEWKVLAMQC